MRGLLAAVALAFLAAAPAAMAQSAAIIQQARATGQTASGPPGADEGMGAWPKIQFETIATLEYGSVQPDSGPNRGPDARLWFDSTFLAQISDELSVDGLFQFKPRQPLSASDPNGNLFINQAPARREGGKMKELYVRYGDYRVGKFVQDFGRAYALLPGFQAQDLVAESEQGYEPTEMIGVERIHVFKDEDGGWRQLSVSAFMVDRTFLHESFPYNEGIIHYKDGGVGNTRWPENVMVTWDVLNKPVGHWAHMNYQASVIRWGKTYGGQRGEVWTTLGADLSMPVHGSVDDTLRGRYSQVRLYVEAARRDNFEGMPGRARDFLSASAQYMDGPWILDLTTTQRWTTDRIDPLQKDELYAASIGYTLPSRTVVSLSAAQETVAGRSGAYLGLVLTQTLTTCSTCLARASYY
ncbi:hypothetical protein DJ021_16555 [Phenylobacterium hankyongense]|uniref:Alginate export domain-containing protein n=1 Tax=Phenylobacterium hankyongense TaxID=1813876 RepID=A0A328B5T2_9CAUL|nr:hypothetical protein DJ021_16555 [Phenylobacterium hankyongense]